MKTNIDELHFENSSIFSTESIIYGFDDLRRDISRKPNDSPGVLLRAVGAVGEAGAVGGRKDSQRNPANKIGLLIV